MEIGEVISTLVERFKQDLNEIMEKNLEKSYPYWIVVLLNPTFNQTSSGSQIIKHSLVVFDVPPPSFSRGLVFEVDNKTKSLKLIQKNLGFHWLEKNPKSAEIWKKKM